MLILSSFNNHLHIIPNMFEFIFFNGTQKVMLGKMFYFFKNLTFIIGKPAKKESQTGLK